MNRILKSLILGLLLVIPQSSAMACPLCKFALESSSVEPRAYMISILFMMGMIMALFSTVAVVLWRVSKFEKETLTQAGYEHLFENGVSQRQSPAKS